MITQAELGFKLNCWPNAEERFNLRSEMIKLLEDTYGEDMLIYVYPFINFNLNNTILVDVQTHHLPFDTAVKRLRRISKLVENLLQEKGLLNATH